MVRQRAGTQPGACGNCDSGVRGEGLEPKAHTRLLVPGGVAVYGAMSCTNYGCQSTVSITNPTPPRVALGSTTMAAVSAIGHGTSRKKYSRSGEDRVVTGRFPSAALNWRSWSCRTSGNDCQRLLLKQHPGTADTTNRLLCTGPAAVLIFAQDLPILSRPAYSDAAVCA